MGELEDRLNAILGDPEQMEKIARLAKKLTGGEPEPPAGAPAGKGGEEPGLDPAVLQRIGRLLHAGTAQDRDRQALLAAMRPYLSEKRRNKMDRAVRIARLAKMAQLAMGESGEERDV